MHDTASRWLFTEGSRNFSHGCIRLQNPLDFVEKAFGGRGGFSKERCGRCIDAGEQAHYGFPEPITLYVTYRTVTCDRRWRADVPRRRLRPRPPRRAGDGQAVVFRTADLQARSRISRRYGRAGRALPREGQPRLSRSFFQYSRRFRISRSKPRSAGW